LSAASPQRIDLDRRLAGLQERPVVLQFGPMDFHPGFDQTLLRLRQATAKALIVSMAKTAERSW
jgi:hypothetical protein